mgnify:CR=1 FL=1
MKNDKKHVKTPTKKNSIKNVLDMTDKSQTENKSLNNISLKTDFWNFKNEILQDLKILEKKISQKSLEENIIIKDELININNNITTINSKISDLTTLITVSNLVKDKVEKLDKIKDKILDKLLVNELKINTLDKETQESIINMNNILKETVIYPAVIGPSCKYKTFHELIDFILNELIVLGNYKEKNTLDLSSYKKKVDTIIQGFNFKINNIEKTSTQLVLENFNACNDKMRELFYECSDKTEKVENNFDKKSQNLNSRIDDLELKITKDINDLKNENIVNANSFKGHIDEYLLLKEDFKKISEISNNLLIKINENEELDDKKNKINKNKIKRFKSDSIEEFKSANSKINLFSNKINKNNYHKEKINSKINSNTNLKINIDNSNLSGNSLNFEKSSEKSMDFHAKKVTKNYQTFSGKDNLNKNTKLFLSDLEEDDRIRTKSPSPNSQTSQISQKSVENNHYIEENKKSNDILTERENKAKTVKIKKNKNLFNKNLRKYHEQNKFWFSELNKKKTANLGNNTISNRLIKLNRNLSSSKYKNIILTLEGSKKIVIDIKDLENGKNFYRVESIKEIKKHPKVNMKKRIISSRPFTINKKYLKLPNHILLSDNDELKNKIKDKNKKIIVLNKSESQNNLNEIVKNKINHILLVENKNLNNEFQPSFNIKHYSPRYSNQIVSSGDKNYFTDKNFKNKDNSGISKKNN